MNTAFSTRPLNKDDSTTSALSIAMVVIMLSAIVIMSGNFDLMLERGDLVKQTSIIARSLQHRLPHNLPNQNDSNANSKKVFKDDRMTEIDERFQQALVMLHAKQYEHAVTALHRVIELSPRLTEAYVNMGFAMLGLERYKVAYDFFLKATDLKPYQANAYWGLAVSFEGMGEPTAALGAMRTYIHLAPPDDPYVRRARSALWEWEDALARGPLPEEEKEFLERGAREWDARNSPQRDMPQTEELAIEVKPLR